MTDPFSIPESPEKPEMPMILAIALRVAQLSFPDLIYSGKVVSEGVDIDDCELCLFARNALGEPLAREAINLEVMKVGEQRSITAEYPEQKEFPILWYGQHGVWMDGDTGQTVSSPINGVGLERLARGILKRLSHLEDSMES